MNKSIYITEYETGQWFEVEIMNVNIEDYNKYKTYKFSEKEEQEFINYIIDKYRDWEYHESDIDSNIYCDSGTEYSLLWIE